MNSPKKTALDLKRGESSIIQDIVGEKDLILALLQQGLTSGTEIKRKQSGIFGDPIAFSVRGTTLSLRKNEAKCLIL